MLAKLFNKNNIYLGKIINVFLETDYNVNPTDEANTSEDSPSIIIEFLTKGELLIFTSGEYACDWWNKEELEAIIKEEKYKLLEDRNNFHIHYNLLKPIYDTFEDLELKLI